MKKQILAILAIFTFGAFLFTSCDVDDAVITLEGNNPAYFDLGQEYAEPGFSVEGGNEEDVEVSWSPSYDMNVVQEYLATYTLGTASAERTVYVQSNALAGSYNVSDTGLADDYSNTVTQSSEAYNKLIISNFLGYGANFNATAVVDGTDITVAKYTPSGWSDGESIEATGTYNGETKALTTFNYTIIELHEDTGEELESTGTLTFTKQ